MDTDKTFLGYCDWCDYPHEIHEKDILPAYKVEDNDARYKCPNCKKYGNVSELIPF